MFFTVLVADAQQNAEAGADLSNDLVSHGYTSFGDSLNDSAHVKSVGRHDVWKSNLAKMKSSLVPDPQSSGNRERV